MAYDSGISLLCRIFCTNMVRYEAFNSIKLSIPSYSTIEKPQKDHYMPVYAPYSTKIHISKLRFFAVILTSQYVPRNFS